MFLPSRYASLLTSFFTAVLFVLVSAAPAAAQDDTVSPDESIADAVENATAGDEILIEEGTYNPSRRIDDFKDDVTLRGESRRGVTIDGAGSGSWGIFVEKNINDVTLKQFTIKNGPAANIKVNKNDGFTLRNVTAKGSDRSEIAISVNASDVTITNVLADGQDTPGVGFALSGVDGVTLDGVTTTGNSYGGVGIFDAENGSDPAVAARNVTIAADGTFNEEVPVYADSEYGKPAQGLVLDGFEYVANNPDYQGRGEDFTFYFKEKPAAVALALASRSPEKSRIQTLSHGSDGVISPENTFVVGTSGGSAMSIQTALDAASSGATVNVGAGTFDEDLDIEKSLTLRGAGDDASDASNTILDNGSAGSGNGLQPNADGVTIEALRATGYNYGLHVEQDIANLTLNQVTFTNNEDGIRVSGQTIDGLTVTDSRFDNNTNGVYLENTTNATVDARNNYWGDPSGPSGGVEDPNTGTVANGSGDAIGTSGSDNDVRFDPWTGKEETETVTDTGEDYTFENGDVTLNFSTLPANGGDVTVQLAPDTPPNPTPGTALSPYLDISSTMTNYDFEVEIALDVSDYANFNADTRLAYFNGDSYVTVPGDYDSNAGTFTFTTSHFTPFAFFNAASATDVYVSTASNTAEAGTVYPKDAWSQTGSEPDDWDFTSSPTIAFWIVPATDASFAASDVTVQWDDAKLDFISAEKDGGIYDGSERTFQANQLNSSSSVVINGSRQDNQNFSIDQGDYIAKLNFELKQPGHSPVDLTTLDLRAFDGEGGQSDVVAAAHGGQVNAFLGDVATSGSSSDESTGDGLVNFEDLSLFSAAYFSGVPDYTGPDNYKVKYDVGPTADGTVYTLPQIDGKIDFEDLVIFSISYGLSGDDIYPQPTANATWPAMIADAASSSTEPVKLSVQAARRDGNELRVPVSISRVSDLRAAHLRFEAPGFELLGTARADGGLMSSDVPALVSARATAQGDAGVADAAVFTQRGLSGEGVLYELRLRPKRGSVSSYTGQDDLVAMQEAKLRSSRNTPIEVETAQGSPGSETPAEFALQANAPNPFRTSTDIRYVLPKSSDVTLTVYDALGRKVRTLVNETKEAGKQTATLQAGGLSSGVYIVVMEAGDFRSTQKMMLVR
jgi:hypothetical protein